MQYGKMLNGQLLIHKKNESGDKPIVVSEPPNVDIGYRAVFRWEETGDNIVQEWDVIESPFHPDNENIPADEAIDIILGGGGE